MEVYTLHGTHDNTVVTVGVGVYTEPCTQDNTDIAVGVYTDPCTQDNTDLTVGVYTDPCPQDNTDLAVGVEVSPLEGWLLTVAKWLYGPVYSVNHTV